MYGKYVRLYIDNDPISVWTVGSEDYTYIKWKKKALKTLIKDAEKQLEELKDVRL